MKKQLLPLIFAVLGLSALVWVACGRKESVHPEPAIQVESTQASSRSEAENIPCSDIKCDDPELWNCIANDDACRFSLEDVERCCRVTCTESCFIPCDNCPPPPVEPFCTPVDCIQIYHDPINGVPMIFLPGGGLETSYEITLAGPNSTLVVNGKGPFIPIPDIDPDTIKFTVVVTCEDGTTLTTYPPVCPPPDSTVVPCDPCLAEINIRSIDGSPRYWAIAVVPMNNQSQPTGPGQLYGNCRKCIPKRPGDSIWIPIPCHEGRIFDVFFISDDLDAGANVYEKWINGSAEVYQNGVPTIDYGGDDRYGHFTIDKHQKCTVDRCD